MRREMWIEGMIEIGKERIGGGGYGKRNGGREREGGGRYVGGGV
jgi:hypothetical protein